MDAPDQKDRPNIGSLRRAESHPDEMGFRVVRDIEFHVHSRLLENVWQIAWRGSYVGTQRAEQTIGTDSGQAQRLNPPYPCHYYMHGAGKYGLQCLNNLDRLPPTGAVLFTAPLKLEEGSGSPLRVLALTPAPA